MLVELSCKSERLYVALCNAYALHHWEKIYTTILPIDVRKGEEWSNFSDLLSIFGVIGVLEGKRYQCTDMELIFIGGYRNKVLTYTDHTQLKKFSNSFFWPPWFVI